MSGAAADINAIPRFLCKAAFRSEAPPILDPVGSAGAKAAGETAYEPGEPSSRSGSFGARRCPRAPYWRNLAFCCRQRCTNIVVAE